eukprot:Anaeramoba_ignava/c19841_g1_i2.p1 GENE.c19841_g1_i2~~c19841_g1_i2.p1  ORF type:complete len:176 (+),score=16.26 c19841_g1_i2:299-826(+)
MKKIRLTVLFLLGFFTLLYGDNRYEVKSGIVKYKISTTGKSFGMSIDSSGERIMYFKNWGNLELSDESISQNMMGNIETTRNMMKVDGKYSYSVDFDEKTIIKTDFEEIAKNGKLIDKNILKSMDAKKTGTGEQERPHKKKHKIKMGKKLNEKAPVNSNEWITRKPRPEKYITQD